MLLKDVNACSFDNWYRIFEKVTFRSIIIPLPDEVLTYLRSDGSLVLPKESDEKRYVPDKNDSDSEDEDYKNDWRDDGEPAEDQPSFPRLHQILTEAIDDLGGLVFPKLNWSCPKDAAWISFGNSLKCSSPSQIWLLLKSSDFITHDLTQPYKDSDDVLIAEDFLEPMYFMVLRRWIDINPGFEFRCFVKSGELMAISQRDQTHHYNYITGDRSSILSDIKTFFLEHIKHHFELDDFTFDVVRFKKDRVKLVDFNPFGRTTDSILFSWEELENFREVLDDVDFRYVENDTGIQPSLTRHYSLPKDIVDIADGTDHDKMVDFLKLQSQMQEKETNSG